MVRVAFITLVVGSTSPTLTPCHHLSMQVSVLLDVFITYNCHILVSDSFIWSLRVPSVTTANHCRTPM